MARPEFFFEDGSRAQQLFRQGRLAKLHFGWNVIATWRLPCDYCGNDFESTQTMSRYCSDECKEAGQREKGRLRVAKHRAAKRRLAEDADD